MMMILVGTLLVLISMVSTAAAFSRVRPSRSMILIRSSSSKLSMQGEAELDDATRGKLETLVGENKVSTSSPFSLAHVPPITFSKTTFILISVKVLLFMKGNKLFPQCGFSNTACRILDSINMPYETVNVLDDDHIRNGVKVFSSWPTIPQLYVGGEFLGGADIMIEMYQSGELAEVIKVAKAS